MSRPVKPTISLNDGRGRSISSNRLDDAAGRPDMAQHSLSTPAIPTMPMPAPHTKLRSRSEGNMPGASGFKPKSPVNYPDLRRFNQGQKRTADGQVVAMLPDAEPWSCAKDSVNTPSSDRSSPLSFPSSRSSAESHQGRVVTDFGHDTTPLSSPPSACTSSSWQQRSDTSSDVHRVNRSKLENDGSTRRSLFPPKDDDPNTSDGGVTSRPQPSPLQASRDVPKERGRVTEDAPKSLTGSEIDTNLLEHLECLKTPGNLGNEGHIYVLDVVPCESNGPARLVKVGRTEKPIKDRARQIGQRCGHTNIGPTHDATGGNKSIGFTPAEKLAQLELAAYKHSFKCKCLKTHGEYFDIEPEQALRAVQRWRRFCEAEPWGPDGKLTPFWEHRRRGMVAREDGGSGTDLDALNERWEWFTSPNKGDLLVWDVMFAVGELLWYTWTQCQMLIVILAAIFLATVPGTTSERVLWNIAVVGVLMKAPRLFKPNFYRVYRKEFRLVSRFPARLIRSVAPKVEKSGRSAAEPNVISDDEGGRDKDEQEAGDEIPGGNVLRGRPVGGGRLKTVQMLWAPASAWRRMRTYF